MPMIPPVAIKRMKPRSTLLRRRSRAGTMPRGCSWRRASRSRCRTSRAVASDPGSCAGRVEAAGSPDSDLLTSEDYPAHRAGRRLRPDHRRDFSGAQRGYTSGRVGSAGRRSVALGGQFKKGSGKQCPATWSSRTTGRRSATHRTAAAPRRSDRACELAAQARDHSAARYGQRSCALPSPRCPPFGEGEAPRRRRTAPRRQSRLPGSRP